MHENLNDTELLQLLKQGNEEAFSQIYTRYWETMYRATFKRLQDPIKSKDIVQDIFMQLWMRRGELQIQNLAAYLNMATRNQVLKIFDKEERFTAIDELLLHLESPSMVSDAGIIRQELLQTYNALIARLTPSQQAIFKLRFEEDLSTVEIAQRMDISRKTVQNQLSTSLALLRSMLLSLIIFSTSTDIPN
ncbi:MAG: RNA polymerase sigma factor [Agriterribacter sp.]